MQARDEARGRLLQVFRFVEALYHQRYPVVRDVAAQPWRLWFAQVPLAPTIWLVARDGEAEDDLLLRVRRPVLTVLPALPLELVDWLEPGWTEPTGSLRLKAGAPEAAVASFAIYQERWSAWVADQLAYDLYEELYDLRARLDREGERVELLVGDGLLDWNAADGAAAHPLLLQPVLLQFDPDEAEFQVRLGEGAPELYTALFRSMAGVEGQVLSRLRAELESEGYEPLGGAETAGFLRRVAQSLAVGGQYIEDETALAATTALDPGAPVIRRAPLLLLRLRTGGFGRALESILHDLQAGGAFPPALARTVGIDLGDPGAAVGAPSAAGEDGLPIAAPGGEDEAILLSKPANPEQLQIARLLAQKGAVLVQGPPGTGKTHTIANLLGHLLAEGKRVLVTSHTSKALQVLREKVVEPLQPLCVSVLDESRRELEAAVDGITDRLDGANPDLLEREAAALQAERLALLGQLRTARAELLGARQEEYRPIEWAGESLDPSEAARQVALGRAADGWMPSPVAPLSAHPLSAAEWFALYRTNSTVSPADEAELAGALPDPAALPEPEAFAQAVDGWQALNDGDLGFRAELWAPGTGSRPAAAIGALRAVVGEMRAALGASAFGGSSSGAPATWRLAVIEAGREGDSRRQAWTDLLTLIRHVDQLAAQAEPLRMAWGPVLQAATPQLRATLAELRADVAAGGSLSGLRLLFKPAWKEALGAVRVGNAPPPVGDLLRDENRTVLGGRPPATPEEFDALLAELDLQLGRNALRERWERQMVALGAPPVGGSDPEPERFLRQFIPQIEGLLGWWE
ncbi:MAG TPA: AAA domain-containing protein, partial [Symbiobacteriaceae bacterium]|nr:AAA domain-containing protein [Symbiobacteriaceae bacterium]